MLMYREQRQCIYIFHSVQLYAIDLWFLNIRTLSSLNGKISARVRKYQGSEQTFRKLVTLTTKNDKPKGIHCA